MPKTLKDLIPILAVTYRSIDIRAVLAKSKAESIWYSVMLKVRLTKDSRAQLKQSQEIKQSKLGSIRSEKFRVVFESNDVQYLEALLSEIKNGWITLDGVRTKLAGADFQEIFQKEVVNDQIYTTSDQRCGYIHKMVFTTMPENPESFTRHISQVTEEEQGIRFSEVHSWLDATPDSLTNPNNVLLIFPIYCKRLAISSDEKEKFLAKYSVHRSLLSCCSAIVKILRNGNMLERREFQLKEHFQSSSEDMTTIALPRIQELLPNDHLELEVIHKSLEGLGLSYDTGSDILESPKVDERKFPVLTAFTYFGAGKNFPDYILSYDNKKQEVSTTWLLSLLDFLPIQLGGVNKTDEKIYYEDRYAADIIAYNTSHGFSLMVDCTTSVPTNDAIDKIRNTANQVNLEIGSTFIPTIFSSVDCTSSIEHAKDNGVVIIDRNEIEELLKLISQGQIDLAKKHLLNLFGPQAHSGK